jgi:hypothetical protein
VEVGAGYFSHSFMSFFLHGLIIVVVVMWGWDGGEHCVGVECYVFGIFSSFVLIPSLFRSLYNGPYGMRTYLSILYHRVSVLPTPVRLRYLDLPAELRRYHTTPSKSPCQKHHSTILDHSSSNPKSARAPPPLGSSATGLPFLEPPLSTPSLSSVPHDLAQ